MAKVMLDKYPLGSFKGQKTDGLYFDDALRSNIDILAEKIVDDLQFLGLCCSSTFEVRSGKSTFVQHIGAYYTYMVNKMHGLNLTFDMKNIVFNSADLIKRSSELPQYSCLILDENDEIDEHYFSKLAKDLRRFFRKSGQLNLFIILIVPNFFQLKSNYAISRSNFLIDVKFEGKFERGYFGFYNFERKKELYIKGKKTQDYRVAHPNFGGRFIRGYIVDDEEYRKAKRNDFNSNNEDKEEAISPSIRKKLWLEVLSRLNSVKPPLMELQKKQIIEAGKTTLRSYQIELDSEVEEQQSATKNNNIYLYGNGDSGKPTLKEIEQNAI